MKTRWRTTQCIETSSDLPPWWWTPKESNNNLLFIKEFSMWNRAIASSASPSQSVNDHRRRGHRKPRHGRHFNPLEPLGKSVTWSTLHTHPQLPLCGPPSPSLLSETRSPLSLEPIHKQRRLHKQQFYFMIDDCKYD